MRRVSRIRDYALERAKWGGPRGHLHGAYADYYAALFFRWCAIYAPEISVAPAGQYSVSYTRSQKPEIRLLEKTREPLREVANRIAKRITHHGTEQSFWRQVSGDFKPDWTTFIVNGERVVVRGATKVKRIAELHLLYALTGSDDMAKRITRELVAL